MSAVAGILQFDGRPDGRESCARMLSAQELYGPDSGDQWSAGDIALGRRLMRLLPEDAFDRQPLVGGNGRFVLVADLRLDNRDDLVRELEIPGPTASRSSDSAILMAAVERWQEDSVDRIVGDYAFALWDASRRRLMLARDPLGGRPLCYHRGTDFFAFASMPKGLHALPEVPYAPDEQRIAEFLILIPDMGPRTFFEGIERVEPGHVVIVTSGGLTRRKFWNPRRPAISRRPDEYIERGRELLDEAVRCRLRGAKDVAATLSGGLDSSAVVATAARLLAPTGGQVTAFTCVPRRGFEGAATPGQIIDEGPLAAATAALYPNVQHVLLHTPNRSPLADLDRNFHYAGQPRLAICNLAMERKLVDSILERRLNVVLGGALGNFAFSYTGMALLPELFRAGRWFEWRRTAAGLVAKQGWTWPHAVAETVGPWFPSALWAWIRRERRGDDPDLFGYSAINPARFEELRLRERARETGRDFAGRPWKDSFEERLWCLNRCDPGDTVKGLLAESRLDAREPLTDIRLVEFCLALPTDQFLRDGTDRLLARRILSDRLPSAVIANRRIGLDSGDWHERLTAARTEVAAELDRLAACAPAARALDLPRLRRLVETWPSEGWERPEVSSPYRLALLRGISVGHFLRRVTGGNA